MNDLSFDDGFERILLEEEPWEQKEDFVDEPKPSCCAINIPETKENHRLEFINEEWILSLLSLTNGK